MKKMIFQDLAPFVGGAGNDTLLGGAGEALLANCARMAALRARARANSYSGCVRA